jgi:YfiH family protein
VSARPAETGWCLSSAGGLRLLRAAALDALPDIAHAFSTRRDDRGEELDLGAAGDPDPAIGARRRRLLAAAGLGERLLLLEQVHGSAIRIVGRDPGESRVSVGDGWVATRDAPAGTVLGVRTADCVPILLADVAGQAIAAVHAGWRGTAAGIARRAVEELARAGVAEAGLRAALGPSIGPCCYEVGEEVASAVARSVGGRGEAVVRRIEERVRLDLVEANRLQLLDAGLEPAAVSAGAPCTACRADLFFSFRRDGPTGRQLACIGFRPVP